MRAKEQSHLPEISQIPGSATNTSIHLSESNTSLSLDPTRNTSREAVALTMSAPSSVILEVPDQDIGCVQISGARPDLSREVEGLVPIAPTQIDRYNRKEIMSKGLMKSCDIRPFTKSFNSNFDLNGWQSLKHPEGALYFYHTTKWVLTDTYLLYDERRQWIEDCINQVFAYMARYDVPWGEKTVLVLESRDLDGKSIGYYFVDHEHQSIFWLDPFYPPELDELMIDFTLSHIGLQILSQYWYHNNLFPNVVTISMEAISQLKDTLMYATCDVLTSSEHSTVPHGSDELQVMRDLMNGIENTDIDGKFHPGTVFAFSRIMVSFMDHKFYNLYGERAARLNSGQSIFKIEGRTWFIKILSPVFLFAPIVYLKKLDKMKDSVATQRNWKTMLSQLADEWKDFTLLATVLLTTNVGFLAIQSVDTNRITIIHQASYISILMSLGSIILGLLLARQHRTTLDMDFITRRGVSRLGLESLALMYSLPYALLVWAMIFFLLSFSCMCYTTKNIPTYILVSSAWMWLGLFVIWCISASFEKRPYHHMLPIRVLIGLRRDFQRLIGIRAQDDVEKGD